MKFSLVILICWFECTYNAEKLNLMYFFTEILSCKVIITYLYCDIIPSSEVFLFYVRIKMAYSGM